jgi:hypothetical protein
LTSAYRKHVYGDLRPYLCLIEDCPLQDHLYPTRHEWLQHESNYHWKTWKCCFDCGIDNFQARAELESHLNAFHSAEVFGNRLETIVSLCEQNIESERQRHCPLCYESMGSQTLYAKHVGWHSRELALFVVRTYNEDDEEAEDHNLDSELDNVESERGGESESDSDWFSDLGEGSNNMRAWNPSEVPFDSDAAVARFVENLSGEDSASSSDIEDIRALFSGETADAQSATQLKQSPIPGNFESHGISAPDSSMKARADNLQRQSSEEALSEAENDSISNSHPQDAITGPKLPDDVNERSFPIRQQGARRQQRSSPTGVEDPPASRSGVGFAGVTGISR